MKILALEPYFGGSHKAFLQGLVANSRHEIEVISMAARFWKWRMQGGAVTLARKAEELYKQGFKPDVILATSMVNVPAFIALAKDFLASVPIVLYFHENQMTYPLPPNKARDYTYGYINYLSALVADKVVFNSHFHEREFTEKLPELLRIFPDYTHFQRTHEIKEKTEVLHLGLSLQRFDAYIEANRVNRKTQTEPPIVLWNQRWEYDKNPSGFFRLMNRLDDIGCTFRLILAGEHFEEQPPEFEKAFQRYADRILHYGYAEDIEEYATLLSKADIVVSTAIHEFFGISILEAIYCGCHPVLPNKLSYPELIPTNLQQPLLHAPILYDDEEELFKIMTRLLNHEEKPLPLGTLQQIPYHLNWKTQIEPFDTLFEMVGKEK